MLYDIYDEVADAMANNLPPGKCKGRKHTVADITRKTGISRSTICTLRAGCNFDVNLKTLNLFDLLGYEIHLIKK